MSKVFTDVSVFLKAVGQTVGKENPEQALLYKSLIDEEYQEFHEAYFAQDATEELDACFDMIWVIVGYMQSRGWDCAAAWEEGAKSNLSKVDPQTGLVRRREDGKILKPDGWQPPNFKQFVK